MKDFSEDDDVLDTADLELIPPMTRCVLSVVSVDGPCQSKNGGVHAMVTLKPVAPKEYAERIFRSPFSLQDGDASMGASSSLRTIGAILKACGLPRIHRSDICKLEGRQFIALVSQRNNGVTGVLENCIQSPGHVSALVVLPAQPKKLLEKDVPQMRVKPWKREMPQEKKMPWE